MDLLLSFWFGRFIFSFHGLLQKVVQARCPRTLRKRLGFSLNHFSLRHHSIQPDRYSRRTKAPKVFLSSSALALSQSSQFDVRTPMGSHHESAHLEFERSRKTNTTETGDGTAIFVSHVFGYLGRATTSLEREGKSVFRATEEQRRKRKLQHGGRQRSSVDVSTGRSRAET